MPFWNYSRSQRDSSQTHFRDLPFLFVKISQRNLFCWKEWLFFTSNTTEFTSVYFGVDNIKVTGIPNGILTAKPEMRLYKIRFYNLFLKKNSINLIKSVFLFFNTLNNHYYLKYSSSLKFHKKFFIKKEDRQVLTLISLISGFTLIPVNPIHCC